MAVPGAPRFVTASVGTKGEVVLTYRPPASDGGSEITGYEFTPLDVSGLPLPATTVTETGGRIEVVGLATGHRYGFDLRAVNKDGRGPAAPTVHATVLRKEYEAPPTGQRIPLVDVDRQSLIVRLDGQDCRVRVWWQPFDGAWYASLEVPINTPVVQSRRLVVGSGLLDGYAGVLAGNIVLRALDEDSAIQDPVRDAWERHSHGLFWEPTA